MLHIITHVILASLLVPTGLTFFTQRPVELSYAAQKALAPQRVINDSVGIEVTANAVLVTDDSSDTVLYAKESYQQLPIASITKLMTALVFLDHNPGWENTVTVTPADRREGGQVYLLPGEELRYSDVFKVMLIGSSNEAAAVLSRVVETDTFVALMNSKAVELGMTQTTFVDPTGLSNKNVSTPRDLVRLAKAAFGTPEITAAVTQSTYQFQTLNTRRRGYVESTDALLESFIDREPYRIKGGKTGYLIEAGYCLLLTVEKDGANPITLAILGSDSQIDRWQEAKGLVDWVYANYQWPDRGALITN